MEFHHYYNTIPDPMDYFPGFLVSMFYAKIIN